MARPLLAPYAHRVLDIAENNRYKMVEAAGVEPASEKARHEENYVRSQFKIFSERFRAGKSGGRLVRLISA